MISTFRDSNMLFNILTVISIFSLLSKAIVAHVHDTTEISALPSESSPFRLGDITYFSRQNFIESGSRCRTADYTEAERNELNTELSRIDDATTSALRIRPINVFFHVIQSTTNQGSVSDDVITAQMAVLINAYSKSGISFTLAGTDKTTNNAWFSARPNSGALSDMKRKLRRGSYADLNVYTTQQIDNTIGFATLPKKVGKDIAFDGVVIDYRTLPKGEFFPYNEGHTLTHETGHWLGLEHTFRGGCAVSHSAGDNIADTPAERAPNSGCPSDSTDTCPGNNGALRGKDPIHNYMDYTDDSCMDNFTSKQNERMRALFKLYRM